jgi:hypothetical protein
MSDEVSEIGPKVLTFRATDDVQLRVHKRRLIMAKLSLGLQLGYWGALAPGNAHVEMAQEAERLGLDSVWTAE